MARKSSATSRRRKVAASPSPYKFRRRKAPHKSPTIEAKVKSLQTAWRTATDKQFSLSKAEALSILEADRDCPYCLLPLHWSDLSVDHKIPRSFGGASDPDNLAFCHKDCNLLKGSMNAQQFTRFMQWLNQNLDIKPLIISRLKAAGLIYASRYRYLRKKI